MSTLHKVKAYFGMAPMDDYDDEYYEDDDRSSSRGYSRRPREDRFDDEGYRSGGPRLRRPGLRRTPAVRSGYEEPGSSPGREVRASSTARLARHGALRGSTRGALAMDPRRMASCSRTAARCRRSRRCGPRITARPARSASRFRDGTPVIMDLVTMDNADAKRLVDFAAGLAFALRGSFDKVATKVFLLSPADVDVTAEERRRIAEAGFYAYQ